MFAKINPINTIVLAFVMPVIIIKLKHNKANMTDLKNDLAVKGLILFNLSTLQHNNTNKTSN